MLCKRADKQGDLFEATSGKMFQSPQEFMNLPVVKRFIDYWYAIVSKEGGKKDLYLHITYRAHSDLNKDGMISRKMKLIDKVFWSRNK